MTTIIRHWRAKIHFQGSRKFPACHTYRDFKTRSEAERFLAQQVDHRPHLKNYSSINELGPSRPNMGPGGRLT